MKLSIGGHFKRSSRHLGKCLIQLAPTFQSLKDAFLNCPRSTREIEWISFMFVDEPQGYSKVVSVRSDAFVVEIGCGVECAPGDASELLLTLLARELPIAIGIAPLQETERAALQRIALQWWQEIRKQRNLAQM